MSVISKQGWSPALTTLGMMLICTACGGPEDRGGPGPADRGMDDELAPICQQLDEAFCTEGEGSCEWDWRSTSINQDCSVTLDTGYLTRADERFQQLLDTVALPGEVEAGSGIARRCAILEQTRQLCADGVSVPDLRVGVEIHEEAYEAQTEANQTRVASCHPGAEVACRPIDPEYANIRAASLTTLTDTGFSPVPPTYCTGQVVGEEGYATTVPDDATFGRVTSWTCSDAERSGEHLTRYDELDTMLLGMDRGEFAAMECPIRKALLDCVVPNLGEGQPCWLGSHEGTVYSDQTGDYCYSLSLGRDLDDNREPCTGTAHCEGRALDFNNNLPGHLNGGNIANCVAPGSGVDCTNQFRAPHIDLPPRFVAIMEGCGFQWLGRTGSSASSPVSEGGAYGCDPMHFELILPE